MKKRIVTIVIAGIMASSCTSKRAMALSESQFLTDSIFSKHLSEYRKHNVYLSKRFDKKRKYSIVYATDGNTE